MASEKAKEKPTLKIIGQGHAIDFVENERGGWIEDREFLFKTNKAIKKCVKYGDVVAFEIDPFGYPLIPELIRELKSQPDAARLRFRTLDELRGRILQGLLKGLDPKEFDIEKVFERIGGEVYFARVIASLKKAGAKIEPMDLHDLVVETNTLPERSRRLHEISVERERNFAKEILKSYRKTGKPPVVMVGAFHAEPLKDILSRHFNVEIEPINIPEHEKHRKANLRVNRRMRKRRLEKLRELRFMRRFQGHNRQLALPKPNPK